MVDECESYRNVESEMRRLRNGNWAFGRRELDGLLFRSKVRQSDIMPRISLPTTYLLSPPPSILGLRCLASRKGILLSCSVINT
jgi:hypothetical protein